MAAPVNVSPAPALPEYSTADSPFYTPVPRPSERILDHTDMAPTSESSSLSALGEYKYSSRHIELNLGPKLHGTSLPSYGMNAPVSGWVAIDKYEHVSEVKITIQGQASTTLARGGIPTQTADSRIFIPILHLSKTLYKSGPSVERPAPNTRIPFSIPLPSHIKNGNTPLPPTFSVDHPNVSGYIRYFVKVDLVRKGLRSHDSLGSTILYLPKSTPPPPGYDVPCQRSHLYAPGIDSDNWKILDLNPSSCIAAQFAVPLPLAYPARRSIPFTIALKSCSAITNGVDIELVKITRVAVMNKTSVATLVLAKANVWEVQEEEKEGQYIRIVKGELRGGKEGGEASWLVNNLIEVKYAIRLTRKRADGSTFEHVLPVEVTTHERDIDDFDVDFPAVGLASSAPACSHPNFTTGNN